MKWFLLALTLCLTLVGLHNQTTIAQTECTFTQLNDFAVELWSTPIGGSSGVMMEPNVPYPIVRMARLWDNLPAYEFEIEDGVTGWYERGLNGRLNGDCDFGLGESVTVAEFPDVCEATIIEPTLLFFDRALTEQGRDAGQSVYIMFPEDMRFLTINSTAISAVIYGGHAMYIGTVASHHLEFDPDCPEKTFITVITAQTRDGARLWSNPHAVLGEITADLPANAQVEIMTGPFTSVISTDGETLGDWYLVRSDAYGIGWIWSERLELSTPFPPDEIGSAFVTDNTRAWSQPSVRDGEYLADIPENTFVRIFEGPIEGAIRTDTDDLGEWYLVQISNRTITAWVWAGRLEFIPEEDE